MVLLRGMDQKQAPLVSPELTRIFQQFDVDGDGALSREEVSQGLDRTALAPLCTSIAGVLSTLN